jgi:molybdopterin-guanine dinucleotide biosynthesis protein A
MTVTGIVLAGGRATRFGGPKLAIELDGTAILARAIAAVANVVDEIIVAGPELPVLLELPGEVGRRVGSIRIVPDEDAFGGPLRALAGALPAARGEIALVVGGDMPRLVPEVLAAMVARLLADPALGAVLLGAPDEPPDAGPPARRQVLPLALRLVLARPAAREAMLAGARSLRSLLDRLVSEEIAEPTWRAIDPLGATLLDVDTQADLDRLRAPRIGDDHR